MAYILRAGRISDDPGTTPVLGLVPGAKMVGVATIEEVRALASRLPRSYEALVRDRVKFRVGRIVYLAFSPGRDDHGASPSPRTSARRWWPPSPLKFLMPCPADLRYHWVRPIGGPEPGRGARLVLDAWRMVVPRSVAAGSRAGSGPSSPAGSRGRRLGPLRPERARVVLACPPLTSLSGRRLPWRSAMVATTLSEHVGAGGAGEVLVSEALELGRRPCG